MSSKRKRNQGDDNGSSRNLDGRRIRTVNEAKALAEYLAVKPEMDRKEKEERRRRWQAVVEAAEKRQEELKNGGGKHKIDGQWMEDKEEMNEKAREAVLAAMRDGVWTDNLRDTILGGSSTSASSSEGSGQDTQNSSEEDSDEEQEAGDVPMPSEPAVKSVPARKFIGFDDDDEFMRCGAYAQTVEPNEPGYYGKTRKHVRKLISETQRAANDRPGGGEGETDLRSEAEKAASTILKLVDSEVPIPKAKHGAMLEEATTTASHFLEKSRAPAQVCDRCHDLIHHNKAVSVPTPTIYSIQEYLKESPHRDNRIYHVIDAADFPLSLVDNIYDALSIQEPRSKNRRASTEKYRWGRKLPTISFVITRSDLLAATKEQVDSKMEYVRSVLRDALKLSSEEFRLGNVHMISAHRGWWTKQVKEDIREHGGGIWVVGKANVGKSSFIEACFPKDSRNLEKIAELVERRAVESDINQFNDVALGSNCLLPPAPREDLYPVLPVVSSVPGTTVSPIRIPFGHGKGEMIDLPGLDRGQLLNHVRDEHKRDLTMTKRKKPERLTVKPGQSLLLGGGLVRITAENADHVLMAACFVPIEAHVTKTEKAVEMQAGQRPYPGEQIMREESISSISSAGIFELKWDVTRSHLPTSIAKAVEDHGIPVPRLPYKVMSTDILIEGCGWVELTVQIRAGSTSEGSESPSSVPRVEVFSPNGQHIGSRPPIECWNFIAEKRAADKRKRPSRGRQNVGLKRRTQQSR
ncbi:hypothetical protein CNMCM6936_008105 [Aspergillus lentulus]|nr:hypothetical protein CNMCM6936_008105 [Aspergillus lentulus]KAF4180332.1 hypothetical protein CNMCM8060_001564 [Aspergillus lentulus]KAF4187075.1 hypothetical protein CNMCM7927_004638 [Aspergillus lentulus]KAF4198650.1 hypothetical protein CNMCM8694_008696 [Aspergillus lentulus]